MTSHMLWKIKMFETTNQGDLLIQTNDDFPRLHCGSLQAGIVLNARVARTAFLGGETTRSCWWLRESKKGMIHT